LSFDADMVAKPKKVKEPKPAKVKGKRGIGRTLAVLVLVLLLVAGAVVGIVYVKKAKDLDTANSRRDGAAIAAANAITQIYTLDYTKLSDWQKRAEAVSTGDQKQQFATTLDSLSLVVTGEQEVTVATVIRTSAELEKGSTTVADCLVSANVLRKSKSQPAGETTLGRYAVHMRYVGGHWLTDNAVDIPTSV
jgi:hypothetical protein